MENLFDLDVQVEASVAPEKGYAKPVTISCPEDSSDCFTSLCY